MTGKSILLVEDDAILAAHLEDMLAALGYRVLKPLATGEAALLAVAGSAPDLVLMDIELAGEIDGVEAARRIRGIADVPVVYLTGYSQDPLLHSAAITAPYGYLVKPVPERELAATVEVALYRHRLDREILASRHALHESEERFRTLFESMSEGVALQEIVYDAAGKAVDYRVLSVNPAFERQTGLPPAECKGRLASELYGTGQAPYLEQYAAVAAGAGAISFQAFFAPLQRHFEISAASPRPGHFATVFRDITERTEMAQALERERRKYRDLFDLAGDAIFVRDRDGMFLDANQVACRRLGYSREELIGKRVGEMLPPEEAPRLTAIMEQLVRDGAVSAEVTQVAKDGRRIPTEIVSRLIEYDGKPAVLGIARDISERKRAEDAQRGVELFLREVLDSLPASVAVLDADGTILSINNGWVRFGQENGAAPSTVASGLNYLSICDEASRKAPDIEAAEAAEGIRAVLEGRADRFSLEYPCHSPTENRWFLMRVSPLAGVRRGAVVSHTSITERMKAQENLREKTAELDRYFNTALDLFAIAGVDGRFRRLNPRWAETLGYPLAELENAFYLDFVHPDDRAASEEVVRRLEAQQAVSGFCNRFGCRDGSWRWLEWHCMPAGDLIFGAARDITARRSAEDALESSQAELRAIYENAPVMMCLIDRKGRVLYANDAFREYLPENPAGGGPGALFDCVHATQDPRGCGFSADCGLCDLRKALDTALQMQPVSNVECRLRLGSRTEPEDAVFLASGAVIESGSEPRVLLCLSDITGRHRAQEAIRQSESNYRGLIDGLPEGVVVHADGVILFANGEAARMLGMTDRESLVGLPVEPFVHPDSLELVRQRRAAMSGGARALPVVEQRYVRRDGSAVDVEVASVSVSFQGRPATHTVFRDITNRKLLEQQLLHAQKMETVGRLAGGVAHDFNNLLTVINGYSRMLQGSLDPADPVHDMVAEIGKAGERAAALTRQLLAFSRKQVMQPQLLDLNAVVEEMRSMLTRLLGERIELQVRPDAQPMPVLADRHQFEQVIMNLAINARDAIPGAGKVAISTAARGGQDGGQVVLTVSDNGAGMDEETRNRIFEPFFTTKGPGKGTGLGLAVVQGIVEQSGGSIEVESEPGRGSSFHVRLPRADTASTQSGPATAAEGLRGSETVLLIEDQREVRDYCAAALASFGYRVLRADGARAALEICRRQGNAIDLVLTDVVMPEVSGPEVAAQLAAMRPGLKVLFMSGYSDKDLSSQGVPPDQSLLLQNPFDATQLAARVRQALGPAPARPHVLVVDGEALVRRLIRAVLERAGYGVTEAGNARNAVAAARRREFAAVITDLAMPGSSGPDAVLALKEALPGAAVVAVTEDPDDAEAVRAAGAAAVLSKPIALDRLVATVRQVLGARGA